MAWLPMPRWRWMLSLLLLLGLLQRWSFGFNWQENLRPKLFCSMTARDYTAFVGNLTSADHFTGLFYTEATAEQGDANGGTLLIGARNIMYKLSASELRLTQTLQWVSSDFDRESCSVKGKPKQRCQNFVKVIQQYSNDPNRYLICGTNAFKPMCREYVDERGSYVMRSERSGLGLAPFDPEHNSTAVLVGEDLYAGTVADLSGVDPIIFRKPLRTEQYDSVQLNSPDFVGSFDHADFVYFFFREPAVEYINCGKSVFSRVARVCKKDQGGPNSRSSVSWTSFLKARLNCSVPGEYPFYFDDIQGMTPLVKGRYGLGSGIGDDSDNDDDQELVLYATFSTPVNSIGASAVCAFRLRDISDAFAGRFKEQRGMSSNWLPVEEHKVPSPRPGTCLNDTKSLPDINLNFIKTHVLMDDTVEPFFGAPIVVRTGLMSRFTVIAVDQQVKTTEGKAYDVIFVGTTNGRVIKAINAQSADSVSGVSAVIIEELQVFSVDTVVKDIKVIGSGGAAGGSRPRRKQNLKSLGQLAVMATEEVRSFPVQRCERASSCAECVALQDPYCAWDIRSARCSSGDWTRNMASSFLQSVSTGHHPKCGGGSEKAAFTAPQVFSYERHLGSVGLGQIVNIIDDKSHGGMGSGAVGAAGNNGRGSSSRKRGGGSGGILKDRAGSDGNGVQVVEASQVLFSLETLIITVSAGAVAALVVGFVTGYCCGRRCRKDDRDVHLPYPDTEYEYFEQRANMARPMMAPGPGAPLLQPTKYNAATEEVTYAEPELVTGLSNRVNLGTGSAPQPPRFPAGGLASLPQQAPLQSTTPPHLQGPGPPLPLQGGIGGQQPPLGPGQLPGQQQVGGYSSSLLNPQNKFNTIHGNKRPGMPLGSLNAYESAAEARLGSGKDPALFARGRDNYNSYHMSTLGRNSSMRGGGAGVKDPLLSRGHRDPSAGELNGSSSTSSANDTSSGGGGGNGAGGGGGANTGGSGGKGQQVTDSAYGTTRSTKNKVYL